MIKLCHFNSLVFCSSLLCCPLLSPQIIGATVVVPPTIKVSEQVPTVGCRVVKETKSKLKRNSTVNDFEFR